MRDSLRPKIIAFSFLTLMLFGSSLQIVNGAPLKIEAGLCKKKVAVDPHAIQALARAEWRTSEGRVSAIKEKWKTLQKVGERNPSVAYLMWFNDVNLIPEDGVVHVIGPGLNVWEWLFILSGRRDLQIIISDPFLVQTNMFTEPVEGKSYFKFKNEYIERLWVLVQQAVAKNQPLNGLFNWEYLKTPLSRYF